MTREGHVRFCERLGGEIPRADSAIMKEVQLPSAQTLRGFREPQVQRLHIVSRPSNVLNRLHGMITNQRDFVLPTSRHIFAVGGDHNHQAEAALIGSKQPVFINLLMGPTVNRRPGAETRKALFVVLKPVAQVCIGEPRNSTARKGPCVATSTPSCPRRMEGGMGTRFSQYRHSEAAGHY